jgi:hypothetical protein
VDEPLRKSKKKEAPTAATVRASSEADKAMLQHRSESGWVDHSTHSHATKNYDETQEKGGAQAAARSEFTKQEDLWKAFAGDA